MSFVLLNGLILNSIVLADDDKASVNEDDHLVLIKKSVSPEDPLKANPDFSLLNVLYPVLSLTGPPY